MECPVCHHQGLKEDAVNCPSCKADLTAYHALNALEKSMNKQKKRTLLFMILFIVALIAGIIIFYLLCATGPNKEIEEKLNACETETLALKAENQQLNITIENLKNENTDLRKAAKEAESLKPVVHIVGEGETLYLIAKNYLGDGNLYTKIARDNSIEDPDLILIGTELVIKK